MERINLNPGWPNAVKLWFLVLRESKDPKRFDQAEAEMLRLAEAYQALLDKDRTIGNKAKAMEKPHSVAEAINA